MSDTNIRCCTDLLNAVKKNCLKCVQILSDDPEQQSLTDNHKNTALHLAVRNLSILTYLLNKMSFLINERDEYGNTPLYYFYECGDHSLITVKLLISRGADVNILNKVGHNSLFIAADGDLEIFKYLWENGANSFLDSYGWNVLLRCAHSCNDINLFRYILENASSLGVDPVSDEDNHGRNIIHIICMSRNRHGEKILSLLQDDRFTNLRLNKYINKKDNLKMTPLMYFLKNNYVDSDINIEFLKTLLSLGADPLIENEGKSCIKQTKNLNYRKIIIEFQDLPPY